MAADLVINAKSLLDAGDLAGAIDHVTQAVKAKPTDQQARLFLFELLSYTGDWQRADRQLEAVGQTSGDIKLEVGVQLYRGVLRAEMARQSFYNGAASLPKFLLEPPGFVSLHVAAARAIHDGDVEKANQLLEDSVDQRVAIAGRTTDASFSDIRDCDDLLSPLVEFFCQGDYFWIPFNQLNKLEIQTPRTLRDLLWIPASIEPLGAGRREVVIPVLYPGSNQDADNQIKLGRLTTWKEIGDSLVKGLGARLYALDENEYPLLELRSINLSPSS
jgi:type VI secretion system protein ImpE